MYLRPFVDEMTPWRTNSSFALACSWDGRLSTRPAAASTAIASAVWLGGAAAAVCAPVWVRTAATSEPAAASTNVRLACIRSPRCRAKTPALVRRGSRWFVEVNVLTEQGKDELPGVR